MKKLSASTRSLLVSRGFHVLSVYQPPHLFVKDGRKLTRVGIPGDPWLATIFAGPHYLTSPDIRCGTGATADKAALAALRGSGDLKGAVARLSAALDGLAGAYRAE